MTAEEISALFKSHNRTLGAAESFTGGLFASEITKVPGASHFFKGSLVTYATEEKARILGVSYNLIDEKGVVSQEVAGEMVSHAKSLLSTDYAVSFTGNAGPDAMEEKPVGEVYIGVASYSTCRVYAFHFSGTRDEIRQQAVEMSYTLLKNLLEEFK